MLRLWGRTSSINVRKVLWTLQELGVPFERIDAGLAYGHNHTPDYLAKNPNALVPMLEDGDFTLWESNAIVRYLCAKYGDATLYPEDLRQRFDAERWMDWQQTTLNRAGGPAFIQWIRTPAEQRQLAVIAQSVAATDAAITCGLRCSAGVRIHCLKAGPLAGFSSVCCQSIQRSASKRCRMSWG